MIKDWVMASSARLRATIAVALLVSTVTAGGVLVLRAQAALESIQASRGERYIAAPRREPVVPTLPNIEATAAPPAATTTLPANPALAPASAFVQAWIDGDVSSMSNASTAALVVDMSPAPSGLAIVGDPVVLEGGETLVRVEVPTSLGPINLIVSKVESDWLVSEVQ